MAHGKVALITGASAGIGRATAIAFLKDGYHVALTARRADALEETARMAGADPARVLVHAADLTKADEVAALFEAVKARFGRLDVLFNNAGINHKKFLLEDVPLEEWQRW